MRQVFGGLMRQVLEKILLTRYVSSNKFRKLLTNARNPFCLRELYSLTVSGWPYIVQDFPTAVEQIYTMRNLF